jgi:hypothetical protein
MWYMYIVSQAFRYVEKKKEFLERKCLPVDLFFSRHLVKRHSGSKAGVTSPAPFLHSCPFHLPLLIYPSFLFPILLFLSLSFVHLPFSLCLPSCPSNNLSNLLFLSLLPCTVFLTSLDIWCAYRCIYSLFSSAFMRSLPPSGLATFIVVVSVSYPSTWLLLNSLLSFVSSLLSAFPFPLLFPPSSTSLKPLSALFLPLFSSPRSLYPLFFDFIAMVLNRSKVNCFSGTATANTVVHMNVSLFHFI